MTDKKAGLYKSTDPAWGDGWIMVSFPYDESAKDAMKLRLGAAFRWDFKGKTWYVLSAYVQDAADLLQANGYQVETDLVEEPPQQPALPAGNPWEYVLRSFPGDADMIFKKLALAFHPDRAKDSDRPMSERHMSLINQAKDAVRSK